MGEIASGGEKRHSLQRLEEIVTLSEVPTSTLHHGLGDKQLGNRLGLIGHQPRRRQKPLASVLVMVHGNPSLQQEDICPQLFTLQLQVQEWRPFAVVMVCRNASKGASGRTEPHHGRT